jgi:hypothetical protein
VPKGHSRASASLGDLSHGQAHRGPFLATHGTRGTLSHADNFIGVHDWRRAATGQQRPKAIGVANKRHRNARLHGCQRTTHHDIWRVISAHGVDRDPHWGVAGTRPHWV